MRVLVFLFAAIACTVASPAAVSYAYSAISPLSSHYPYAAAYSPFAYGAGPVAAYSAAPAVVHAAPVVPAVSPIVPYAAPVPAIAAAYAAPYAAPAPVIAGVKSQYHAQDELGQASYGHAEPAQAHHAVQDAAGNKVGSFSFINPEGKFVQTNYVADAAGYRVASNDLPVAPVYNPVLPAQVQDTPEVAAAKSVHLAKLAEASRSKRSVTPAGTTPIVAAPAVAPIVAAAPLAHAYSAYPYAAYPYGAYPYGRAYPHAYPTTAVAPVTTPQGFNADTPEVAEAKANHFAEHAAARARVYGTYPYIY